MIDLDDNQLVVLGEEGSEEFWGLFSRLETLRAAHNKIRVLGAPFCMMMVTLTSLDVASNELEELPPCLGYLRGEEFLFCFVFCFIFYSLFLKTPSFSLPSPHHARCLLQSNQK